VPSRSGAAPGGTRLPRRAPATRAGPTTRLTPVYRPYGDDLKWRRMGRCPRVRYSDKLRIMTMAQPLRLSYDLVGQLGLRGSRRVLPWSALWWWFKPGRAEAAWPRAPEHAGDTPLWHRCVTSSPAGTLAKTMRAPDRGVQGEPKNDTNRTLTSTLQTHPQLAGHDGAHGQWRQNAKLTTHSPPTDHRRTRCLAKPLSYPQER
jgi:hypothetical protein